MPLPTPPLTPLELALPTEPRAVILQRVRLVLVLT